MNNGVNQPTNNQTNTQTVGQTTNQVVNTQQQVQNSATTIASMHPQVLAASNENVRAQAQNAINTAGVQIGQQNVDDANDSKQKKEKKVKKKNVLARFYFFIILLLCVGMGLFYKYHQQQMVLMNERCTPVSTKGDERELDLNSNIVKDLYSRVKTSLLEDAAQPILNDEMKLYLAYRQLGHDKFYDSHCKGFEVAGIEPFTCQESASFTPKAFKVEDLEVEYRKMFGYDAIVPRDNIQLGNSCIGGYKYIENRGEYVQGKCNANKTTLYRVDKELVSAYSKESIIVLRERVKYYGSEGLTVPQDLKSGVYEYKFKLDMNYNYVYVEKKLVSE